MSLIFRSGCTSIVFAAVFAASGARADLGFPAWVKFPAQLHEDPDQALVHENVADVEFSIDAAGGTAVKRGAHYARWLRYVPSKNEPAVGYYNGSEERIANAMTAVWLRDGWKSVWVSDDKSRFTFHFNHGGADVWAMVKMDAPQALVNVELIEPAAAVNPLKLRPPAATPEKLTDADDFPYLTPFPGSTRKGAGHADGPLDVAIPGSEAVLVGTAVASRDYAGPSTLSEVEFTADYRAALTAAGWTVNDGNSVGLVIAHYAQHGRDVWAKLAYFYGGGFSFSVVDVGGEDWAARLEKTCRVPLYGVFFDFNKATIRADSEPVLSKAAALLKGGAVVEVQGHTDSAGADAYNQKLSEDRAASVKAWLAAHGVDAAHLSSKGYGESQPVADNGTAEGRARNRRVELVKAGCRPK